MESRQTPSDREKRKKAIIERNEKRNEALLKEMKKERKN